MKNFAKKTSSNTDLKQALERIRDLEAEIQTMLMAMKEKIQQMELLTQVSSILNSSLDPEDVREKTLEVTCEFLKCETASLLLVDSEKAELYWDTALGETGKALKKNLRLPINDRSIAGSVAMSGESLLINDVEKDPRHFKKATEKSSFQVKSMLCVPLRNKGKVVGVLQALNKLHKISSASKFSEGFQQEDLQLLETLSHPVSIAVENSKLYTSLKRGFYDTVEALAESIEKKDHYTGGHTKRVVHFSLCVAKYMDLTPEEFEQVKLGALLNDVGKIGVDDKILKKQAPLDPEEWKVMRKHPELGFDIMKRVESLKDVMGGMRFHHERWDGKGYPLGLKGEEIPLIARIIAVADAYDAMVSTRPYRKGLPAKIAYEEILKYKGIQFDPHVVDAFIQAYQKEKMGQKQGESILSNCD